MSGRVTGAVQDLESASPDAQVIALIEPAIRSEGLRVRKTEHLCLLWQGIQPEGVRLMRPQDLEIQVIRQFWCGTDVIEMAMGQQDHRGFGLDPL